MAESPNFGVLGDVWKLIPSFASNRQALYRLSLVSKSTNALVWSSIKTITFVEQRRLKSEVMYKYLKKCPNLKTLVMDVGLLDHEPTLLAQAVAPQLEEFHLTGWCYGYSSKVRQWTHFKHLKQLSPSYSFYKAPLSKKMAPYPSLTHLKIDGTAGDTPHDSSFLSLFPNLISFKLNYPPNPFDLRTIPAASLAKLQRFGIKANYSVPAMLHTDVLAQCQNLTSLSIYSVSMDHPEILTSLDNLQELFIDSCSMPGYVIRSLQTLKNLRTLSARVVPYGLEEFQTLTQLRSLVYSFPTDEDTHINIPPGWSPLQRMATFEVLKDHTNLTQLEIRESRHFSHHISHLTNLTNLDLRPPGIHPPDGPRLKDGAIYYLHGLTKLSNLNLGGSLITNQGWGYLTQLTNLTSINLANSHEKGKIDDFGLRRLRLFPLLQKAILDGHPLITGRGLDQLSNLVHLETLELNFTSLRSKYFPYLTKLPSLTYLNVSNSLIDNYAMAYLKNMPCLNFISMWNCPNVTREAPHANVKDLVQVSWEFD